MKDQEHIIIHGYTEDDMGQHWCSVDDFDIDGYTVYRRLPVEPEGFKIEDELDFIVFADAQGYAERLAQGRLEVVLE